MITIFVILWFLSGLIGLLSFHYTALKEWYIIFEESNKGQSHRRYLWLMSPIFIIGGLITFIMAMINFAYDKNACFYFKIPKDNKKV